MAGESHPESRACGRFEADLSAFADHTLAPRRWEQVGYHVAGCDNCRREVAAIKELCTTLSGSCAGRASTPDQLASRLQQIAGEQVDAPLYMAAGMPGELPSRRRERRRLLTGSGAAAVTVLASLFVIVLLIAPSPPLVDDAVRQAREEFSLSTTAISVNEAVGAVLLAHQRGALPSEPVDRHARSTIVSSPRQISPETAADVLGGFEGHTFSGLQRVWISDGSGSFHVADVRIDEVAGQGASFEVLDARGDVFHSWFVPSSNCCAAKSPEEWTFHTYDGMDQVAGRWAHVVEARDSDGRKVARWWLDTGNGMLLWSERYDTTGAPTLISGYVELELDTADLRHEGIELISFHTSSTAEVPDQEWCTGFDHCPDSLAGLPLVAYSSSNTEEGQGMRLVYSDGFRAVTACWTEGRLPSQGAIRAYDDVAGLPKVAIWQSGPGVVSVATNGSLSLLHEAVGQLPGEAAHEYSLMERVRQGGLRLIGFN